MTQVREVTADHMKYIMPQQEDTNIETQQPTYLVIKTNYTN